MPPSENAEIIVELTQDPPLAEVIQMTLLDEEADANPESYYARNSGLLPRLEAAKASDYNRSGLPSPVAAERETLVSRAREFFSGSRPSRLSSR